MFEIKGFRGKNNVADPARILPSGGASFLAECRDADIDDELMVHRRKGFGPPVYPGSGDSFPLVQRGDLPLCPGGGPEKAQSGLHGDNDYFRGGTGADGLCGRGRDRLPDQRNVDRIHARWRFSIFFPIRSRPTNRPWCRAI